MKSVVRIMFYLLCLYLFLSMNNIKIGLAVLLAGVIVVSLKQKKPTPELKSSLPVHTTGHISFDAIPHVNPLPDFVSNALRPIGPLIPAAVKQRLSQVNDSVNLINTTVNPKVFFERYDFLFALLLSLVPHENKRGISFDPKPSDMLKDLVHNRDKNITEFIGRAFVPVNQKCRALKTDRGRENAMKRFREGILEYRYLLAAEHIDYLSRLTQ